MTTTIRREGPIVSTEIQGSRDESDWLRIHPLGDSEVSVTARDSELLSGADRIEVPVGRADLLYAVRAELDVVIIDKAGLPEVERYGKGELRIGGSFRTVDREFYRYDPEDARQTGLRLLALAQYLGADLGVDEAQVKALADVLGEEGLLTEGFQAIARRLVERGVRVEVAS